MRSVAERRRGPGAVFLDRDGPLNHLCYDADHGVVDSPMVAAQLRLVAEAPAALRLLRSAGLLLVLVSNQPAAAKGKTTLKALGEVDERLQAELRAAGAPLDAAYYCYHHPAATHPTLGRRCDCRKPEPGLLLRATSDLGIDLRGSWMVGDGLNDVEAAARAGCRSIWIGRWRCEHCQVTAGTGARPDARADHVLTAARHIVATRRLA